MTDNPDIIITTPDYGMRPAIARTHLIAAMNERWLRERETARAGLRQWPGPAYRIRIGPISEALTDDFIRAGIISLARLGRMTGIVIELLDYEHRNAPTLENFGSSSLLRSLVADRAEWPDPALTYRMTSLCELRRLLRR